MMISSRGRYVLRIMVDFAEHRQDGCISLKEAAQRQGISVKYLEKILPVLVKSGEIESIQGRKGGYRLTREPGEYRVGELLRLTEGNLAPVSCLEAEAQPCQKIGSCATYEMWQNFHKLTNEFFDGITIADLMDQKEMDN